MLIEILYKNGHKQRRICGDHDTLVSVVQVSEAQNNSKIQSIRVVKRDHKHQGDKSGQ